MRPTPEQLATYTAEMLENGFDFCHPQCIAMKQAGLHLYSFSIQSGLTHDGALLCVETLGLAYQFAMARDAGIPSADFIWQVCDACINEFQTAFDRIPAKYKACNQTVH